MQDFFDKLELAYFEKMVELRSALYLILSLSIALSTTLPGLFSEEFLDSLLPGSQFGTGIIYLVAFLLLFPLLLLIWLFGREIYFRSGRGYRIAVAYTGYEVPIRHWVRTRRRLNDLVKASRLTQHLSVRLVPCPSSITEEWKTKLRKRRGFSSILEVHGSKSLKDGAPSYQFSIQSSTNPGLRPDDLALLKTMADGVLRPLKEKDISSFLDWTANNLYCILMLHIGYIQLCNRNFELSTILMECLEFELSKTHRADAMPRVVLRDLIPRSKMGPLQFPADSPPPPSVLESLRGPYEDLIAQYSEEQPHVRIGYARYLFYVNDLEGALAAIEPARGRVFGQESIRVTLAEAVLNLLLGRYSNAGRAFDAFLKSPHKKSLDWEDLILFADYAADMGYEHAIFLQGLYRRLNGRADTEIKNATLLWLEADKSRAPLKHIYNMARAAITKSPKKHRRSNYKRRR